MDDRYICIGGAIKALGNNRYGGYLVRFYNPDERDLQGEWFSKDTEFILPEHPVEGKPVLFHHAMDLKLGAHTLGTFDKAVKDENGIWAEWAMSIRDERKEYIKHVQEMIEDGLLDFSSGALPGSVRVDPQTKHIDQWCIAEGSATHTPADWRSVASSDYGTRILSLKALQTVTPREALPIEVDSSDTTKGVEESTIASKTLSLGAKMSDLRSKLKQRIKETMDSIIEEVIAEFSGEIAPEDVAAVADEVLSTAEAEGADLSALEEPEAMAMMDEDEYKAETPEDEQKAVRVRKAAQFVATSAIKAIAARREVGRKAVGKFAKNIVKAAQSEPGESVRDRIGGGHMTPNGNTNGHGHISVSENLKFAHLSGEQMAMGLMMLQANAQKGVRLPLTSFVSVDYLKHMKAKIDNHVSGGGIKNPQWSMAVKSVIPAIKADELDATNIVTQGAEWVGEYYSTVAWEKARNARIYKDLIAMGIMEQEIPQGFDTAHFPTEEADPRAYRRNQANNLDATGRPEATAKITPFNTSSVSVTPNELSIATSWTKILEEDSLVAILPQASYQVSEKMEEEIESLLLNGDTAAAANTNINLIDGTPATGLETPAYRVSDGFLKLALVTNTAMSRDGTTLDEDDYLDTYALFPSAQRSRQDRFVFVVDPDTALKTLRLAVFKTMDIYTRPTIESGELPNPWGIKAYQSGFMAKANANGKISVTAGNNTKGRILAIYAPYWGIGYKRRITFEQEYSAQSGTTVYVATVRIGLVARSNTASAVTYNLTV